MPAQWPSPRQPCVATPTRHSRRMTSGRAWWSSVSLSQSRPTMRQARTILQIKPRDDREKTLLLDRASTSAYIAYQRADDRNQEADSLSVLGRTLADRREWRGALDSLRQSLELRETGELRGEYE